MYIRKSNSIVLILRAQQIPLNRNMTDIIWEICKSIFTKSNSLRSKISRKNEDST